MQLCDASVRSKAAFSLAIKWNVTSFLRLVFIMKLLLKSTLRCDIDLFYK